MRKLLLGLGLFAVAGVVYANCVTNTIMSGGRMTVCTTCCYYGNCTTTCI